MLKTLLWAIALVITTNLATANAVTLWDVGIDTPRKANFAPEREVDIKVLLHHKIEKYGLETSIFVPKLTDVIQCESSFNPNAINSTPREYSVGLVQINLWAHPHITEEQAKDIDFALDFLVKNVSEGRGYWWTCYHKYL